MRLCPEKDPLLSTRKYPSIIDLRPTIKGLAMGVTMAVTATTSVGCSPSGDIARPIPNIDPPHDSVTRLAREEEKKPGPSKKKKKKPKPMPKPPLLGELVRPSSPQAIEWGGELLMARQDINKPMKKKKKKKKKKPKPPLLGFTARVTPPNV